MIHLGDTLVWFKVFESDDFMTISRTRLAMFWHQTKRDSNGCWIWQGVPGTKGYGQFGVENRQLMAHRLSYAVKVGPIPDGLILRHKCDQRPCVNYGHLEPGTHLDNARDKVDRHRMDHLKTVSDDQVIEMRIARASGCSVTALSNIYGTTAGMVSNITTGRSRCYVGGPLTKSTRRSTPPVSP